MSRKLKYQLVIDYIQNEIWNGTYKHGDKLQSEKQLMDMFSISRQTVREAMMRLSQEGLIQTLHGKGSFYISSEQKPLVQPVNRASIAVVAAYINNHTMPPIIDKIQQTARANGYSVSISCTHNTVIQERQCLLEALAGYASGVILEPSKSALPSLNDDLYQKFRERKIPLIFIHGCHHIDTDDYVMVDDEQAGYAVGMHLIKMGHSKVGGIFKSDDMQGPLRYHGVLRALIEQGVNIDERKIIWLATQDEKTLMHDHATQRIILARLKECTAVVCYNDDSAIQLADFMIGEGISVPQNLSIISFDNTRYGSAYRVPITSIDHPYGLIGKIAIESLLAKIQSYNDLQQHMLKTILIEKASVSLLTRV